MQKRSLFENPTFTEYYLMIGIVVLTAAICIAFMGADKKNRKTYLTHIFHITGLYGLIYLLWLN